MALIVALILGQVVATRGAVAALAAVGTAGSQYLNRHQAGDWGEVSKADARANDASAGEGSALSVYTLPSGVKIWIKTDPHAAEDGRNVTTILLPDGY